MRVMSSPSSDSLAVGAALSGGDQPRGNKSTLEPPTKRAKVNGGSAERSDPAMTKSERWSWPQRVDDIACSAFGECLGATSDTGQELTWQQVAHKSKIVAKALRRLGLTGTVVSAYPKVEGERVEAPAPMVVMMGHTVENFCMLLGVLRQGFPLLPLSITHADKKQLRARYKDAMELFKPVAIISDSPLANDLLEFRPGTHIISPQKLFIDDMPGEAYQDIPSTLDCVLAYIFTSGSTGRSKCVTATNRMAWSEIRDYPQLVHDMGHKIDPRRDRWRIDHESGWWGAAFFGEVDVALAFGVCIVFMKPNDPGVAARGVTMTGALPSQLQNLWPGARNIPSTLRLIFSWAERCDVELGQAWKRAGVKITDLLIATEFWLSLASPNLEVARMGDGRAAHAMRPVAGAQIFVLGDNMEPLDAGSDSEVTGMMGIGGPQVSPGYAELSSDGTTLIGAGEMSKDVFKVINGQWVVVPKDIVKKRPDGSFVSVGRGGGLVKVKGGVLMATGVVEMDLQQRSIAAACITDPVHVEGGSCVVLEINWQDVWSFCESLQQASFLRMPVLYVCQMPRNASTGKVQKALVQAALEKEHEAEKVAAQELHVAQQVHYDWYVRLASPFKIVCAIQPWTLLGVSQALWYPDTLPLVCWPIVFVAEFTVQLCLVSWTYGACAHAGNLGPRAAGVALLLVIVPALAAVMLGLTAWPSTLLASILLALVVTFGHLKKEADQSQDSDSKLSRVNRLQFAVVVGMMPRWLPFEGTTAMFIMGLLSVFAVNRCLPAPPWASSGAGHLVQRLGAITWSFLDAPGYMLCFPVAFVLALPSLVLAQFPAFAWKRQPGQGQPPAKKQLRDQYCGPRQQYSRVTGELGSDGCIWIDVRTSYWQNTEEDVAEKREVIASTPAGGLAQSLARQAGVDFQSVDSLRISRLSVLLKKNLKPKLAAEHLEFQELREACGDEQTFVSLVDERMVLDQEESTGAVVRQASVLSKFISWLRGGSIVHREGATQAPWDCLVDVLLEWRGSAPLDQKILNQALAQVACQHPLLRARPPPDDSTDALLGTGRNDFSTTAAATWHLVAAVWARHQNWSLPISQAARRHVAYALWRCWPRTLVVESDDRYRFDVQFLSKAADGWTKNAADEVSSFLSEMWSSWWNPTSMVNVVVVALESGTTSRQFVYCSISHKYADGGAAAAFVQSLSESYEALLRGEAQTCAESPILSVHQNRLQNYLLGEPCPEGSLDVHLFDIVNDIFQHGFGHTVGTYFTENVCNMMRVVGVRLACSEEIAWLSCIVCAMSRMMPDEELLKIMIVHNGRLGEAEGAVACTSNYVMLTIPCCGERSNIPLADVASRVKFAVTHGRFRRPFAIEQSHAKLNINGMVGVDGNFAQVFKTHRCKKPGWSRAPHVIQLRMDNEGGIFCVKDFKCHQLWDPQTFWEMVICAGLEIADGWFINPLSLD